jgi:hypothetical protein
VAGEVYDVGVSDGVMRAHDVDNLPIVDDHRAIGTQVACDDVENELWLDDDARRGHCVRLPTS